VRLSWSGHCRSAVPILARFDAPPLSCPYPSLETFVERPFSILSILCLTHPFIVVRLPADVITCSHSSQRKGRTTLFKEWIPKPRPLARFKKSHRSKSFFVIGHVLVAGDRCADSRRLFLRWPRECCSLIVSAARSRLLKMNPNPAKRPGRIAFSSWKMRELPWWFLTAPKTRQKASRE